VGNFVLFSLILLVLASLLRIDFFFTVLYLFLSVYIFSRFWARRSMDRLRVKRRVASHAFLGDTVDVTLQFKNKGRLPVPWLMFNETLPVKLVSPPVFRRVISLGAGENGHYSYRVHCRRRGYYALGPLHLESGDLLGLARVQHVRIPPAYLTVYPRVMPLEQLRLPTHSPQVVLPTLVPLFEDPARIIGVRDYVRGDSPRRIHWTASASAGRLLVKQYQSAIARETSLFLNLNVDDFARDYRYTAPELSIVVAASMANHIISREKLAVGLVTEAYDPRSRTVTACIQPPRKERAQLMTILETLARVEIAKTSPFLDLVRRQAVHLSWGATLVLITPQASNELLDTVFLLTRMGFQLLLVFVQAVAIEPGWREHVERLGIAVHRVWNEDEVGQWT
jgi:uncharacterized protein (DUF58 family)